MKVKVCVIGSSELKQREFGGYEWGCQVICARALRFLQQAKESGEFPSFHGYENIIGVLAPDNEAAKKLDAFILQHEKLREYGMTGAMHQFGVQHALKIFQLGRDEYLKQLADVREPGDFFEFEEDEAFPESVTA